MDALVIVVGPMTRAADRPRSRRVLRLIALERIARGVLLLTAGVYLLFNLNSDFGRLAERVMRAIELDPRRPFFHRILAYLHHLHASQLRIAATVALAYGALESPATAPARYRSKKYLMLGISSHRELANALGRL